MYASFFGLSREPFSIAPDPRFLFMSERHREALAHLLYGVGGGGGFVLLTGEIGAGKTTVGRCFLEQLPAHCAVAYIFNPRLSVGELLQTICSEFGIASAAGSIKAQVDALNRFLLEAHAQGRQALLVIDEAQSLSAGVLEQLRLLTNLETAERKLLQIILIGQPELRLMLAQPGLEQLAQRVIARYHLGPLSREETAQYVAHRLAIAGPGAPGAPTPEPFDAGALAAIHRLTGGVPRRINLLADRALLGAYAKGRHRVDKQVVAQAAREVFDKPDARPPPLLERPWTLAFGSVALALLGAVGVLLLAPWQHPMLAMRGDAAEPVVAQAAQASRPDQAAMPQHGTVPVDPSGPKQTDDASAGAPGGAPAAGSATDGGDVALSVRPLLTDPAPLLAAALTSEATAWRELGLRWNVAIGEGDPCDAVSQAQLACYRSTQGGLPALRQLARPALLVLFGTRGERVHALLVGLDEQQATLQVGAQRWTLALPTLASIWRGEFATFWRTPPGWRGGSDALAQVATRAWVAQQLGADSAAPVASLREQVAEFQVVQGLPRDGRAGPLTLMLLNREAGVQEPQLEPQSSR